MIFMKDITTNMRGTYSHHFKTNPLGKKLKVLTSILIIFKAREHTTFAVDNAIISRELLNALGEFHIIGTNPTLFKIPSKISFKLCINCLEA